MNPRELRILDEIEAAMHENDAAFAARIASGPRLTSIQKASLAATSIGGIALTMLFSANIMFGLFGYVILVAVGTTALRRRPLQPAQESPLELVHRMTGGLFRDPGNAEKPSLD